MALLLGIDTGGTYTDAVVLDDSKAPEEAVIAKAKALTSRPDLSTGIGEAIDVALKTAKVAPSDIELVSLSTTLATNALVEGQGEHVALVAIGFEEQALSRGGLAEALGETPVIRVAGGHHASGAQAAELDIATLEAALADLPPVRGIAIAGQFSVRNPDHEVRVRDLVRSKFGLPTTCSHELSAKVGGPKRALTTLLNARLVGLIDRLVEAVEGLMQSAAIDAPLMVVRGDGALVAADFARTRPIETILSGPAASLVGAGFLTGAKDALISDIGGTTTDVAVLRDGRPRLDPEGAMVGGMRTMVEAVAMDTHGLGGDSEVRAEAAGMSVAIHLGPRRAAPLSLLARDKNVRETLERQLNSPRPLETDGRFLVAISRPDGLEGRAAEIMGELSSGPVALDRLGADRPSRAAIERLVARGMARFGAFTPTDAAHVLGWHDSFDREAAIMGAKLLARTRNAAAQPAAQTPEEIANRVIEQLLDRSARAVLATAFSEDGYESGSIETSELVSAALAQRNGLLKPRLTLEVPLVGLGASAPTYYPKVADILGAVSGVPEHADVANAVGAVAGRVSVTREALIIQAEPGVFRLHHGEPRNFTDFDKASNVAKLALHAEALAAAKAAGASDIEVRIYADIKRAEIEGQEVVYEARIVAEASGRPRLAHDTDTSNAA